MRKPIAMIRINAGNPGWYDPLTNIHLTITRPTALVYEGANTTNIRNAIRHRLISVLEGDLDVDGVVLYEVIKKEEVVKEVREVNPQPEAVKEEVETKAEIIEEVKTEETVEAVEVEEVVVEEKPKKTTRKRTTKKEKPTE